MVNPLVYNYYIKHKDPKNWDTEKKMHYSPLSSNEMDFLIEMLPTGSQSSYLSNLIWVLEYLRRSKYLF